MKMKQRWYTQEEIATTACPFSVGQAEAGRYTYCVGEVCMGWQWFVTDALESKVISTDLKIPEGWVANSPVREDDDGKEVITIIKKPTHGRCALVPRIEIGAGD